MKKLLTLFNFLISLWIITSGNAYAQITWTAQTPSTSGNWVDVVYGNGLFVSLRYNGGNPTVMTSPDGVTWTNRSALTNWWQAIAFGNGKFVAVSENGYPNQVMTSPDGITWSASTNPVNLMWYSVTFGNGLFVATSAWTGTGNRVMTSPDGITWTIRASAGDFAWTEVTYGGGLFVAVANGDGASNQVMTSPDGITWTLRSTPGSNVPWTGIAYGNGIYAALSTTSGASGAMTSTDGITWTMRTTPASGSSWLDLAFGGGYFAGVSYSNGTSSAISSTDGITWTIRTTPATNYRAVTYGNGKFVAAGAGGVMTSIPPVTPTWTSSGDNNWATASNWTPASVPLSTDNVIIQSTIACGIYDTRTAANVTINAGCRLVVINNFTVNGSITNTGTFEVDNGGKLIQNGAYSGTGTCKITRNGSASGYSYWSSPFATGAVNVPAGTGAYKFNHALSTHTYTDDGGPNYLPPGQPSTQDPGWSAASGGMSAGEGYAVKAQGTAILSTTSSAGFNYLAQNSNISAQTYPGNNSTSTNPGSNLSLIGNPYPAPIKISGANSVIAGNSALIDVVYLFYDNGNYTTTDYSATNSAGTVSGNGNAAPGGGNIGACQGFFVHCIGNGTIGFTPAMRNTGTNSFFKTEEDPFMNRIWLDVYNDTRSSEILVAFMDGATDQQDVHFDAPAYRGTSELFLTAKEDGDEYCIATFPPVTAEKVVPVGVFAYNEDTYTFNIDSLDNMENISVFLEDRLLGTYTDMSNNATYSAMMNKDNCTDRFFLHFAPLVSGIASHSAPAPFVSYFNGTELVTLLTPSVTSGVAEKLILTDMTGKILVQQNVQTQSSVIKTDISNLAAGMYVVSLQTETNMYSRKIAVSK